MVGGPALLCLVLPLLHCLTRLSVSVLRKHCLPLVDRSDAWVAARAPNHPDFVSDVLPTKAETVLFIERGQGPNLRLRQSRQTPLAPPCPELLRCLVMRCLGHHSGLERTRTLLNQKTARFFRRIATRKTALTRKTHLTHQPSAVNL